MSDKSRSTDWSAALTNPQEIYDLLANIHDFVGDQDEEQE